MCVKNKRPDGIRIKSVVYSTVDFVSGQSQPGSTIPVKTLGIKSITSYPYSGQRGKSYMNIIMSREVIGPIISPVAKQEERGDGAGSPFILRGSKKFCS